MHEYHFAQVKHVVCVCLCCSDLEIPFQNSQIQIENNGEKCLTACIHFYILKCEEDEQERNTPKEREIKSEREKTTISSYYFALNFCFLCLSFRLFIPKCIERKLELQNKQLKFSELSFVVVVVLFMYRTRFAPSLVFFIVEQSGSNQ